MSQRTLKSLDNAISGLRSINPRQFNTVYKKTLQFYLDVLIIRHFLPGYAKSQAWTPNTQEYQEWKRKKGFPLIQLVLHGNLRESSQRGRINKNGKKYIIRWRAGAARRYGAEQSRLGRDWASPSSRDSRDLIRKFKQEWAKIRAKVGGIKTKK